MDAIEECPPDKLADLVAIASADETRGLAETDRLLNDYSLDPRLHFLRGSLLAGLRRYPEARQAMHRAIEIAPGFALARFQAGLLELTSGEAALAEATWAPLQQLAEDEPLRLFATGLNHLARDEFDACIATLRDGMERNTENPVLNRDMQMVIDETQRKMAELAAGDEPTSAAHMLLRQYGKETKH